MNELTRLIALLNAERDKAIAHNRTLRADRAEARFRGETSVVEELNVDIIEIRGEVQGLYAAIKVAQLMIRAQEAA